jgi:hypothetical protein
MGVTRILMELEDTRVLGVQTLVLGILRHVFSFYPLAHIAQRKKPLLGNIHVNHSIIINLLLILSNIPYQGGAIIGVFMVQA